MPIRIYVKEWREHRGLTRQQLADRCGIVTASLGRLEVGNRPWNSEHLEALAEALGAEPQDLLKPPAS